MTPLKVRIFCDGASRGNPGPASAGAVLYDAGGGQVLGQVSKRLGVATNNTAEYRALILALQEAARLGAREVDVFADSQLLVRQINGQYRVKHPGIKALHQEASGLLAGFAAWKATHVPREQNRAADALANRALDRAD